MILDELPLYNNSLTSGYDVCDEFNFLKYLPQFKIFFLVKESWTITKIR
ncbi:MAG: hypothetical protein ABIK93_01590 [candidate division WOR-3 bacterium]